MDNLTRYLAYLDRVALSHAKDPDAFNARFAAGLRLQTRDFKWLTPASPVSAPSPEPEQAVRGTSNVLRLKRRRA